jgi:FAD/FMN-containing dehydrogenase
MERIASPWIHQECRRAGDLEELLRLLREAGPDWPYTVAWMDDFATGRHFGRGVVIQGRWADPAEAPAGPPAPRGALAVPFDWPRPLLNRLTGRAFYELLWRTARAGPEIVHPETFFYPLDVARAWNRMYGSRGFTQYQCVVPDGAPFAAVRALCETLRRSGVAAFLVTVKDFGGEGPGLLSFPMRGTTFAFDVPLGPGVQRCVDRMNEQVAALGGRIYLAKDLLTRPEHLCAMEPRLPAFSEVRRRFDPQGRVRSALSARLLGDAT